MNAFTALCDMVDDFTSPTKMAIDNAADSISSAIESANFSSRWQIEVHSGYPETTISSPSPQYYDGAGDIELFSLIIKAVALITYIVVVCKLAHYFIFAPSVSSLIVLCGVVGSMFIYFILKAIKMSKSVGGKQ